MLPLFYLGGAEIEPIPCKCPVGTCRSAAGCRTLLTICPQGQIGHRFPYPAPKQNSIPSGCCFCFWKKGRESNPSNASARWALAVRQLDAERSLRFAPKGKSAIDSRTLLQSKTASHRDAVFVFGKKEGNRTHPMQVPGGHLPFGSWMPNAPYDLPPRANRPLIPVPSKAPSMAQLTTFILNQFIFFPPVLPVLGDQKSRAQLCGFCQLRNCAAARILIVSKLNAK